MSGPTLLLGGAGFLGGHIIEALLERGRTVRVFDRVTPPAEHMRGSAVDIRQGDFGNRRDLAAAVDGCENVIHLMSTTVPKTSNDDPAYDIESNVVTTLRFLDIARDAGVKKIVFASSGGTVYGPARVLPIPEHHETAPICSYGIHKLAIERYLELYSRLHGVDYCVLRTSNLYGERQRTNGTQGAVAVFLERALRGVPVEIWGNGSVVRDYVYVKDVARAFCLATEYAGRFKVFNIGSGRGLSLNDLLTAIESLLGCPVERRYAHDRPFDVRVNVLDITRAEEHLRWRPEFSLREGLDRTMEWLRSANLSGASTAAR